MKRRLPLATALALLLVPPAFAQSISGGCPSDSSSCGVTATGGTTNTLAGMFAAQITAPIATGTAATDTANIQTALSAVPSAGARVFFPAGTYVTNAVSNIKSNTHIVCAKGAVFQPAASYGATKFVISNVNYSAGGITDHDIIIEGCAFDMTNQNNAGFHAIDIRMARNVQILRPNCPLGGGDCTALEANDNTVVADGYAATMLNACWDHWDAPTNGVVRGGECSTAGTANAGVLVTGTNTALSSAGVAKDFVVEGGTYNIGSNQACIWVNGLGAAGSGASYVRIIAPVCNMAGGAAINAIKVSGAGTDNQIISPTISGAMTSGASAIITSSDAGGTPTNTQISGAVIDAPSVAAGTLVILNGTNDRITNTLVTSGTYAYGIKLAGTNQFAAHNVMPIGSSGYYNLTGTGFSVIEPDLKQTWTPQLFFGGGATGQTYGTQTGEYWLNGKTVRLCAQVIFSSKGSSTGAVTLNGLPFSVSSIGNYQSAMSTTYTQNFVGLTSPPVFKAGASNNFLNIVTVPDVSGSNLADTNFGNATGFIFCGNYEID